MRGLYKSSQVLYLLSSFFLCVSSFFLRLVKRISGGCYKGMKEVQRKENTDTCRPPENGQSQHLAFSCYQHSLVISEVLENKPREADTIS